MNKRRLITFVISFTIFLLFIFTTSPYHLPLLLVIVPGAAFIVAIQALLSIALSYVPIGPKVRKGIVHVLTIVMAVIAVLLSVGQLTFRDFALLLALALFGTFYLSRMLDS